MLVYMAKIGVFESSLYFSLDKKQQEKAYKRAVFLTSLYILIVLGNLFFIFQGILPVKIINILSFVGLSLLIYKQKVFFDNIK